MRQFVVPQFIDVEDKIIGPITVRQFIIIVVAGLILFLEYKLSDLTFFIFTAIPTMIVFGTIAFVKVNGMPFHFFILNVIQTFKKPALRVWQREVTAKKTKIMEKKEISVPVSVVHKRPVTKTHLSDLSLLIDTGGIYEGSDIESDFSFKT